MLDIILGAIALGLLWAVMALGVYITYRVLDVADLTVEGTIALGGAVAARFISGGMNPWLYRPAPHQIKDSRPSLRHPDDDCAVFHQPAGHG